MAVSVSSNVYYDYQPLLTSASNATSETEPMCTDEFNRNLTNYEMDTTPCEYHPNKGKRHRECTSEKVFIHVKRKRLNEPIRPSMPPKTSPMKTSIDEELLRETHGCTIYHWASSDM